MPSEYVLSYRPYLHNFTSFCVPTNPMRMYSYSHFTDDGTEALKSQESLPE